MKVVASPHPDDGLRALKAELAAALATIDRLQALADTDYLLGIFNRRGFERELNRSLAYIKRYKAEGALIVLDVDGLKPINDAFGHATGDAVLKAVAAVLKSNVRASDVIGRMGGDEFALLLWNLSQDDALAKAAALEQAVDNLGLVFAGRRVETGASAGTTLLTPADDALSALARADVAMYGRKQLRKARSQ